MVAKDVVINGRTRKWNRTREDDLDNVITDAVDASSCDVPTGTKKAWAALQESFPPGISITQQIQLRRVQQALFADLYNVVIEAAYPQKDTDRQRLVEQLVDSYEHYEREVQR